jgi:hypothetical protein
MIKGVILQDNFDYVVSGFGVYSLTTDDILIYSKNVIQTSGSATSLFHKQ